MAHIIDDRTVQRQSVMGVSSVDNEESLEEDVIAGMRHTYLALIFVLGGKSVYNDFGLKLPASILTG